MDMKKLSRFGLMALEGLASSALVLVFVLNTLCSVVLTAKETEMQILGSGTAFYLSLCCWGLLAVWMIRGGCAARALRRWPCSRVFMACACAYIAGALWLFAATNPRHMVYDTQAVFSAAQAFGAHDYEQLSPRGYVGRYPHQLSLVLLIQMLQGISGSPLFFRILNVLCVLGTNAALMQAGRRLGGEDFLCANLTVLLSFACVPQLLSVLFIYGNIPSLLLTLLSALALLRAFRTDGAGMYALSAALLAAAYLLRTNVLIAAIALAILCVLHAMRTGRRRCLAAALCLFLAPAMAAGGVKAYYRQASGMDIPPGIPKAAWVVMGLSDEGSEGGWYNGYTDQVYNAHGHDGEAAKPQIMQDLVERLYDFKQDPTMALRFAVRKLASTWCEPTFESVAIHQLDPDSDCYTPVARSLFGGGGAFYAVHAGMQGLMAAVYLLAGMSPLLRRRRGAQDDGYASFALVYFLGGVAFHLLWETKSLYVWAYAAPLIPLAAQSVQLLGADARKNTQI